MVEAKDADKVHVMSTPTGLARIAYFRGDEFIGYQDVGRNEKIELPVGDFDG